MLLVPSIPSSVGSMMPNVLAYPSYLSTAFFSPDTLLALLNMYSSSYKGQITDGSCPVLLSPDTHESESGKASETDIVDAGRSQRRYRHCVEAEEGEEWLVQARHHNLSDNNSCPITNEKKVPVSSLLHLSKRQLRWQLCTEPPRVFSRLRNTKVR